MDRSTLLVHDAHNPDPTLAIKLSLLNFPESPYPMGIFRQVEEPVYEEELKSQDETALKKLLNQGGFAHARFALDKRQ